MRVAVLLLLETLHRAALETAMPEDGELVVAPDVIDVAVVTGSAPAVGVPCHPRRGCLASVVEFSTCICARQLVAKPDQVGLLWI